MLDTKTNFVDEKVEIDPKDLQVSFDNNTTETKDEKAKEEPKAIKVSLGNDSEALAEEKSKPKEKQDKDKIKQLEKSIKDREKEIKDQVKNNKKYKPGANAWNGAIDEKNADDYSYIVNKWKNIPQSEDFKSAASTKINDDVSDRNFDKDREYYLNLSQRGFEEWNDMQENPDDPDNYEKWVEEKIKWGNNAEKALEKYDTSDEWDKRKYSQSDIIFKAFKEARSKGDYDAAAFLYQAYKNAIENEKAKDETSTETATKKEENRKKISLDAGWDAYNKPTGSAKQLFEIFKQLKMDVDAARREFFSKIEVPSEAAEKAFEEVYGEPLLTDLRRAALKFKLDEREATKKKADLQAALNANLDAKYQKAEQNQDFQVGSQTPRKVLNEAQSETSKNIKDVILDETYQTLTDDEKRDALKKATEKALNKYSSSFIDKANTRENAAQLSKFLPRFAIQHFLEGNFGDKKDPKSWGTLGYFLLDKVGKSLVNASQVARGFSPTERTVLEDYNKTMLENAFGRDNENRKKILNSSLDTLVKDSDVLREVGISDFKIFDDFTEKVLTQYQDNIQNVNLDKILKEKSDFIINMPSEEQQKFIGYLIAMDVSEPGSAAYLNAAYRAADMEQRFAKTDAEKYAAQKSKTEINLKLAGMEVNNKTLFAQLDSIELKNEKDRATMAAEIDRVARENEKLIEEIKRARTENSYLAKEKEKELEQKVANIVSTYANVGANTANTVSKIIDAIIPG